MKLEILIPVSPPRTEKEGKSDLLVNPEIGSTKSGVTIYRRAYKKLTRGIYSRHSALLSLAWQA